MAEFRDRFHERHPYHTMSADTEPRGGPMSDELLAEFQQAWEKAPQTKYRPDLGEAIEDMVYSITGYCPPIHYLVQDFMYGWEEKRYESGELRSRIRTVFGVRDGEGREWYENGQLKSLGTYVDGQLEGTFLKWRDDGTPCNIRQYVAGKEHGCREEYRNGTLCMDFIHSHGELIQFRTWRENGTVHSVYPYQNGKAHGIERHYHRNGRVSCEFTNHNGNKHGIYREWSDDGQLYYEGSYKHGEKHGKWTYDDGSVAYYNNGVMVRQEPIPLA
jgi:antitoxin component YwqK of YwqJK toxin-antitoxin module